MVRSRTEATIPEPLDIMSSCGTTLRTPIGSGAGPRGADGSVLNALTIDLEDYFQVSGFEEVIPRANWRQFEPRVEIGTEKLLTILAEFQTTATFFVLGWTAQRHPALIRRIHAAGHEIGCHSYAHRLVYECTRSEFRQDTHRAKAVIEDIVGGTVAGYRAPSFSITAKSLWALEILAEEGFQYDSSVFPIFRDRYGIPNAPRHPYEVNLEHGPVMVDQHSPTSSPTLPTASARRVVRRCDSHPALDRLTMCPRASILEMPPSTVRWLGTTFPMGGGGYLRLFPDWLFHFAIHRIVEKEKKPAILYLHPWELDPDQPRIRQGSWLSRFRHTVNLDRTESKLKALLSRWRFSSLARVIEGMDDLPLIPATRIATHDRLPCSG